MPTTRPINEGAKTPLLASFHPFNVSSSFFSGSNSPDAVTEANFDRILNEDKQILPVIKKIATQYKSQLLDSPNLCELDSFKKLLEDAQIALEAARLAFDPRKDPEGIKNYNKHAARADAVTSLVFFGIMTGAITTAAKLSENENLNDTTLGILIGIALLSFIVGYCYLYLGACNAGHTQRRGFAALPLVDSLASTQTQKKFDEAKLQSFFDGTLSPEESKEIQPPAM